MFKSNKVESIGGLLGVTRKIVIFTERVEKNQYLVDFRKTPELYQYLPNIYIFLRSKVSYYKIKKLMQSANRITYKK